MTACTYLVNGRMMLLKFKLVIGYQISAFGAMINGICQVG